MPSLSRASLQTLAKDADRPEKIPESATEETRELVFGPGDSHLAIYPN